MDFPKPLQLDTAYLLSEMLAQTIGGDSQVNRSPDLSNSCKNVSQIHNANIRDS